MAIDTVTGLNLFDENGSPLGQLGTPNDKQGDAILYPIPAIDRFTIQVQSGVVDKIYTIPSDCDDEEVPSDVTTLLESHSYTVEELELAAGTNTANTYSLPGASVDIDIEFSSKSPGFYRVFILKADGELLWYNTYIDPNVTNYPDFSFYDMLCL